MLYYYMIRAASLLRVFYEGHGIESGIFQCGLFFIFYILSHGLPSHIKNLHNVVECGFNDAFIVCVYKGHVN